MRVKIKQYGYKLDSFVKLVKKVIDIENKAKFRSDFNTCITN